MQLSWPLKTLAQINNEKQVLHQQILQYYTVLVQINWRREKHTSDATAWPFWRSGPAAHAQNLERFLVFWCLDSLFTLKSLHGDLSRSATLPPITRYCLSGPGGPSLPSSASLPRCHLVSAPNTSSPCPVPNGQSTHAHRTVNISNQN